MRLCAALADCHNANEMEAAIREAEEAGLAQPSRGYPTAGYPRPAQQQQRHLSKGLPGRAPRGECVREPELARVCLPLPGHRAWPRQEECDRRLVTTTGEILPTGACRINRPCAQQYVGKSQSCMVISGRLIVHAPVYLRVRSRSLTIIRNARILNISNVG